MNEQDHNNLNLLSIFHYVLGGLVALFSCMPFIHVFMGLMMVSGQFSEASNDDFPAAFGWIFVIMGSIFILLGWSTAICMMIAGKKLKARQSRLFCMIIAGIECMFMPFGTALGVFTLITLNKEPVKEIFDGSRDMPPIPPQ